jgi:hypothetical protein
VPADIVPGARREMLALDLRDDATDNAGTEQLVLRKLGDDVVQELIAVARMDRRGGLRAPLSV